MTQRPREERSRIDGFDACGWTGRYVWSADRPVKLHLASDLRVATNFNWYTALWADHIMASIQRTILEVERQRAESGVGAR